MKQHGRKIAALEVVHSPLDKVERQTPPHELNEEEVEVWFTVVNSMPADWFTPPTVPLLAQYCRHAIQAKRVAELIKKATADKNLLVADYNRLLQMQDRESRALSALGTKMRITQKSMISEAGKKTTPHTASHKPWQG